MTGHSLGALLLTAAIALLANGCGDSPSTDATIAIRYSQFVAEAITVPAGVPVTITLRNDDPIDHEWIVGTPEVHERHRTGAEPFHDEVPTEVTIPALSTRVTTLTLEWEGEYAFICHLPGHEAYGMVGRLLVVEADGPVGRLGGSAWESNPPGTGTPPRNGFEDREAHRDLSTPEG